MAHCTSAICVDASASWLITALSPSFCGNLGPAAVSDVPGLQRKLVENFTFFRALEGILLNSQALGSGLVSGRYFGVGNME